MSLWVLIAACLIGPPVWAVLVTAALRRRARRRAEELRAAAPPVDYLI